MLTKKAKMQKNICKHYSYARVALNCPNQHAPSYILRSGRVHVCALRACKYKYIFLYIYIYIYAWMQNIHLWNAKSVWKVLCQNGCVIFIRTFFDFFSFHSSPHCNGLWLWSAFFLFAYSVKIYNIAFWHALAIFLAVASSFHLREVHLHIYIQVYLYFCLCLHFIQVWRYVWSWKKNEFVFWWTIAELPKINLIKFIEPNFDRSVACTSKCKIFDNIYLILLKVGNFCSLLNLTDLNFVVVVEFFFFW